MPLVQGLRKKGKIFFYKRLYLLSGTWHEDELYRKAASQTELPDIPEKSNRLFRCNILFRIRYIRCQQQTLYQIQITKFPKILQKEKYTQKQLLHSKIKKNGTFVTKKLICRHFQDISRIKQIMRQRRTLKKKFFCS